MGRPQADQAAPSRHRDAPSSPGMRRRSACAHQSSLDGRGSAGSTGAAGPGAAAADSRDRPTPASPSTAWAVARGAVAGRTRSGRTGSRRGRRRRRSSGPAAGPGTPRRARPARPGRRRPAPARPRRSCWRWGCRAVPGGEPAAALLRDTSQATPAGPRWCARPTAAPGRQGRRVGVAAQGWVPKSTGNPPSAHCWPARKVTADARGAAVAVQRDDRLRLAEGVAEVAEADRSEYRPDGVSSSQPVAHVDLAEGARVEPRDFRGEREFGGPPRRTTPWCRRRCSRTVAPGGSARWSPVPRTCSRLGRGEREDASIVTPCFGLVCFLNTVSK